MTVRIFSKGYIKSIDLCKEIYPDSKVLAFFKEIERYFSWGKYKKVINRKEHILNSGDIQLTEQELSKKLQISRYYVSTYLSLLCEAGILCKSCLARNIIIYSLAEKFYEGSVNPFEQAKQYNLNKSILKGKARSRWIKGRIYTIDEIEAKTQKRNKKEWEVIQFKIKQSPEHALIEQDYLIKQHVVNGESLFYDENQPNVILENFKELIEKETLNKSFTQFTQQPDIKSNSLNSVNFKNKKNLIKSNSKNDQNKNIYTVHYIEDIILDKKRNKEILNITNTCIYNSNSNFLECKQMENKENYLSQKKENLRIYSDQIYGKDDEKIKKEQNQQKAQNQLLNGLLKNTTTKPPEKVYEHIQRPVRTTEEQAEYEKQEAMTGSLSLQIQQKIVSLFGEIASYHLISYAMKIGVCNMYDMIFKVKPNANAEDIIEILRTCPIAVKDGIPEKLEELLNKRKKIA